MMHKPRFSRLWNPALAEKMEARVMLDPVTGCWNWTKGVNADGYGNGIAHEGKQIRSHRLAYFTTHGYLPPSDFPIRHLCSNPSCCCPDHLSAGTAWDNVQDMMAAGRHRSGGRSLRQRKADALAIISAGSDVTHMALAERLGVSLSTVTRNRRRAGVKSTGNRKLTEGDIRAIRQSDEPKKIIAARYGVSAANIHAIRQLRTWRHVS